MSEEHHHQVGLSRRELERELQWIMRHLPSDPAQVAKLMAEALVTLIDKNNAAMAKRLDRPDDGNPGGP